MARGFNRQPSPTLFLTLGVFLSTCLAQNPATNTPVPPLQWIELTSLLTGSVPPPLKYASMGYDSTSGTVLVFGGESNGFPTQQTYLLNTTSLTWSMPSPPNDLNDKPSPRSEAISGQDFAASNRHGHIVIGGKGQNGSPLSDAWEFDYINQFWTQINVSEGGPSARLSASGGTDPLAEPFTDLTVEGPNNTFYLFGGFDGKTLQPLSDAWKFEVAGVLSPNLPSNVVGSWSTVQVPNDLPSKVRQGSAVFPSGIVTVAGGCSSNDFSDNVCAQQDGHIINFNANRDISPPNCPAPRVGPVVVPNYNTFSSNFISQAFVVLGTFNNTLWDDGGGLQNGEVDVFSTDSGSWTRILPSGDPGTTGTPKFPVPREGAASISSPFAIFGANHAVGSDTIIFGGQDAQGNFLKDVWLLRSYMGALDTSNETWSGSGSGTLETGVDASGTGVTNQYLTTCATALAAPPPSPTSSSGAPTSSVPAKPGSTSSVTFVFDTDVSHKLLSPISISLLLVSIVLYRLSLPAVVTGALGDIQVYALWLCALVGVVAYGVGIAGIVFAFTTISASSANSSMRKRSTSSTMLKTGHGKAGLALFICLYGLLPIVIAKRFITHKRASPIIHEPDATDDAARKNSTDTGFTLGLNNREKKDSFPTMRSRQSSSPHEPDHSTLAPDSPVEDRHRTHSFHLWPSFMSRDKNARESDETAHESHESENVEPTKGFVVLNRGGHRMRRLSANAATGSYGNDGRLSATGRSLSDLSWLDRRRSLNVVGELDYALSQLNQQGRSVPTPLGFETASNNPLVPPTPIPGPPIVRPQLPSRLHSFTHIILHFFILGVCVVALVALWERAPKATFVVFLLWTLAFYAIIISLSWRGRPQRSILSVLLFSLRDSHYSYPPPPATPSNANAGLPPTPPSSRPLSTFMNEQYTFPSDSRGGPYIHQPLFRRALSTHEDDPLSSEGHDEDDEDENARQRRIEQEMDRRDVSIVTVPKRKLWVTNPS